LAAGDAPREGDLDGRGNLSDRTLTEFCAFFLQVCLDQAKYMDGLLALNGLVGRLEGYVQLREKGLALGPGGVAAPLRPEVAEVLRAAATRVRVRSQSEGVRPLAAPARRGAAGCLSNDLP
jgi:hypothetical protein